MTAIKLQQIIKAALYDIITVLLFTSHYFINTIDQLGEVCCSWLRLDSELARVKLNERIGALRILLGRLRLGKPLGNNKKSSNLGFTIHFLCRC